MILKTHSNGSSSSKNNQSSHCSETALALTHWPVCPDQKALFQNVPHIPMLLAPHSLQVSAQGKPNRWDVPDHLTAEAPLRPSRSLKLLSWLSFYLAKPIAYLLTCLTCLFHVFATRTQFPLKERLLHFVHHCTSADYIWHVTGTQ